VVEEDLDEVALAVVFFAEWTLELALGFAVDDWSHALVADRFNQRARIVSRVSDEHLARCVLQQGRCHGHFVSLSGCERDVQRPASRIDEDV